MKDYVFKSSRENEDALEKLKNRFHIDQIKNIGEYQNLKKSIELRERKRYILCKSFLVTRPALYDFNSNELKKYLEYLQLIWRSDFIIVDYIEKFKEELRNVLEKIVEINQKQ